MLQSILSMEVLSLLFATLSAVAALSVPAIFWERRNRRKYRRPTETGHK